ncbi:MAG: glycosyltransferase family 4 protein [Acidimicrobiales bacterium]
MRVALVSGYDWSVPGGVQGQVAGLARCLDKLGESVAVVTPQSLPAKGPSLPGVHVFRAGRGVGLPVNGSRAPVAPLPSAWWAAVRALRGFSPDIVHVHEPFVPGPPLAAALMGPLPMIATFHRSGTDRLYRAEAQLLGRAVTRRCAMATGVSRAAIDTAETVLGRHLRGLVEVSNGVEGERFEQARVLREAAGLGRGPFKGGGAPVVAFLGRLEPRKGASLVVQAVRELAAEIEVHIVGDGPEAGSLRRQASSDPRVRFFGRIDDDEVATALARADVFVAPATTGESFGMVLLEAMSAGTAVVASDIPGYRIAAGGAARLFRSGDSQALAAALREVLGDHQARAMLVKRGEARAQQCSMAHVATCYLELYKTVAISS